MLVPVNYRAPGPSLRQKLAFPSAENHSYIDAVSQRLLAIRKVPTGIAEREVVVRPDP